MTKAGIYAVTIVSALLAGYALTEALDFSIVVEGLLGAVAGFGIGILGLISAEVLGK
jgi:hypothetical protein